MPQEIVADESSTDCMGEAVSATAMYSGTRRTFFSREKILSNEAGDRQAEERQAPGTSAPTSKAPRLVRNNSWLLLPELTLVNEY